MSGDPGLFGDEEGAPSPFSEALAAAGSGRIGRPKGALNRKTEDFERWYHAAGYKDPAQLLAEIVSADPLALAKVAPGKTRLDALKLQVAAAEGLMPYLHGKMPTRIEVTDERLPTLILVTDTNQIEEAQQVLARRLAMSLGVPLTIEGETVESPGNAGVAEGGE